MILGIIIAAATSAGAAILYQSSQVSYSNSNSGLSSTNVQAAIDELSNKMSSYVDPMTIIGFATDNDYGNIKIWINDSNELCTIWPRGSDCFKPVFDERVHLFDYFDLMGSDSNAWYFGCNGAFCPNCTLYISGGISCDNRGYGGGGSCTINSDYSSSCT